MLAAASRRGVRSRSSARAWFKHTEEHTTPQSVKEAISNVSLRLWLGGLTARAAAALLNIP